MHAVAPVPFVVWPERHSSSQLSFPLSGWMYPLKHAVHSSAPVDSEKRPAAQGTHALLPRAICDWPAGQSWQPNNAPAVAYCPALHVVQLVRSTVLSCPALQFVQKDWPIADWCCPIGHVLQASAPMSPVGGGDTVPSLHNEQFVDPMESANWPAAHALQLVLANKLLYRPAVQFLHSTVEPSESIYRPFAHSLQLC